MPLSLLLILVAALAVSSYFFSRRRSVAVAGGASQVKVLHSLPSYYGFYGSLWAALPALLAIVRRSVSS